MKHVPQAASQRAIRLRDLWPLFAAYAVSQLGGWVFRAGAVYDIFDKQGGEGSVLGWTLLCVYIPILVGGKWLAPLSDKYNSIYVMIALDVLCTLILLPVLFGSDMISLGNVLMALLVIVGLSLATPVFTAAQSSLIRKRVAPEQVTTAMSVLSNITWATNVLGTVGGSLLLLLLSFKSIILINLLSFVFSGALLFMFLQRRPLFDTAAPQKTATAAESAPAAEARAKKIKWVLLSSIFFLNLGAGVINLFPAVAARDIYQSHQIGLSYFYLGNGIGGFVGTLLIVRLRKHISEVPLLMTSSLAIGLLLLSMSWFPSAMFSILISSLMLMIGQVFGVIAHTYLLTSHAPEQAGRTSGLFMFATFLGVAVNAGLFSLFFSKVEVSSFSIFMQFCGACSLMAFVILAVHAYRKRGDFNHKSRSHGAGEQQGNKAAH
ncbi:MFS transporter [Paenibacillus sp. KS-LC4]|uniref:MFS transporter n=1 Tax=Paenibacillus sp. KS-LC4 TaxID=2979727 RepID=UPI0030D0C435